MFDPFKCWLHSKRKADGSPWVSSYIIDQKRMAQVAHDDFDLSTQKATVKECKQIHRVNLGNARSVSFEYIEHAYN